MRVVSQVRKKKAFKESGLLPGDKVKMVNCCEARDQENADKVWVVRSEPWNLCGSEAVLLEGKAGGFATKYLERVR